MEELVAQAVDDPCHKTNAVPVTGADFRKLYLAVL
jgi:alcohol dehydrogenase class IV